MKFQVWNSFFTFPYHIVYLFNFFVRVFWIMYLPTFIIILFRFIFIYFHLNLISTVDKIYIKDFSFFNLKIQQFALFSRARRVLRCHIPFWYSVKVFLSSSFKTIHTYFISTRNTRAPCRTATTTPRCRWGNSTVWAATAPPPPPRRSLESQCPATTLLPGPRGSPATIPRLGAWGNRPREPNQKTNPIRRICLSRFRRLPKPTWVWSMAGWSSETRGWVQCF